MKLYPLLLVLLVGCPRDLVTSDAAIDSSFPLDAAPDAASSDAGSGDSDSGVTDAGVSPDEQSTLGSFRFAVSWLPGYCSGHSGADECRALQASSPAARSFSLHGLWQFDDSRIYCNVSDADRRQDERSNWDALAEPTLTTAVRTRLQVGMPGHVSFLHRHEWTKHGTCYGTEANEYFSDALSFIENLNATPVQDFFETNIGRSVSLAQIRASFDDAFGAGTGQRVDVQTDGAMLTDLYINVRGTLSRTADVGALIRSGAVDRADETQMVTIREWR